MASPGRSTAACRVDQEAGELQHPCTSGRGGPASERAKARMHGTSSSVAKNSGCQTPSFTHVSTARDTTVDDVAHELARALGEGSNRQCDPTVGPSPARRRRLFGRWGEARPTPCPRWAGSPGGRRGEKRLAVGTVPVDDGVARYEFHPRRATQSLAQRLGPRVPQRRHGRARPRPDLVVTRGGRVVIVADLLAHAERDPAGSVPFGGRQSTELRPGLAIVAEGFCEVTPGSTRTSVNAQRPEAASRSSVPIARTRRGSPPSPREASRSPRRTARRLRGSRRGPQPSDTPASAPCGLGARSGRRSSTMVP